MTEAAETEPETEAATEAAAETEAETEETVLGQDAETVEADDLNEAESVFTNDVYVWAGDYKFNPAEYVSESWYDKATEDLAYESGSVDLSAIGKENEVVYRVTPKGAPEMYYFVVVPYVPVADKDDATIRVNEIRGYIEGLANTEGFSGKIPATAGETLDGGEITVVKGSDVSNDFYSLGYDTARFAVQLEQDKSDKIDYNTAGDYKAVFYVSAYENADYYWYISVTVHVVDTVAENHGVTVILDTMGLTGTVTTEDGSVEDLFYGKVLNTGSAVTDIVLKKNYGKSLDPQVTVQVNGEEADAEGFLSVVESDDETYHAAVSGLDVSANDYVFHIGFDGWDPFEGGNFKAGGGWASGDDMYSKEDYLRDMQAAGLLDENGRPVGEVTDEQYAAALQAAADRENEGNGVMTIAAKSPSTKTFSFNTSSISSPNDVGCFDHGDRVANRMTVSLSGVRSQVDSWFKGLGYSLEHFPSGIAVNCVESGRAGFHHGEGSNIRESLNCYLKVTVTYRNNGDIQKVSYSLTAYNSSGTDGYQSFYGSASGNPPIPEEGTLVIRKSSEGVESGFLNSTPLLSIDTQFGVYSNRACTDLVTRMAITDLPDEDDGEGTVYVQKSKELKPGDYWVKELRQADGHTLANYAVKVKVEANKKTFVPDNWSGYAKRFVNRPFRYTGKLLDKVDGKTGLPVAGAVFRVDYWTNLATVPGAQRLYSWYFRTDANGAIAYDAAHYLTTWNGQTSSPLIYMGATPALPIGTLYFYEVDTPADYLLAANIAPVQLTQSSAALTNINIPYTPPKIPETRVEGPIEIRKYVAGTGFSANRLDEEFNFEGTQYTIYNDEACGEGNVVEVVTLDKEGYGKSSTLPRGKYWVKETLAPPCGVFEIDESTYETEIAANPQRTAVLPAIVICEDTPVPYPLDITKSVKEMADMTPEQLEDLFNRGILAEVRFRLTHKNAAELGRIGVIEVQCDKYGKAKVDLFAGKWTIEEIQTPDTYHRVMDPEVIVANGITPTYEFGNVNVPYEQYVRIRKHDLDTGEIIDRDHATVQILKENIYNGEWSDPIELTVYAEDGKTKITTTEFETNRLGIIRFAETLSGGHYKIVETKPPYGYEKIPDGVEFEITEDGEFKNGTEELVVDMHDHPVKGKLRLTKIDRETGEHCGPGYTFEVVTAEDILDGSGKVREGWEKGTVIDTIVTDEDGIATSDELYVGNYFVRETTVPGDGYTINPEEYSFEVTGTENDNEVKIVDLNFDDQPTTVKVFKTDSVTGTVLEGVRFRIKEKDAEDDDSQVYVTDAYGEIAVSHLKPGTYTVQEIETIPGYNLNDKLYEFTVDGDGLIDCGGNTKDTKDEKGSSKGVYQIDNGIYGIDVVNNPNVVHITKRDITNSAEVPGATLRITDASGMVWAEWVSTTEPHQVTGLPAGQYTLTEILPPQYYELASSIQFTVEDKDNLEVQPVEMFDKPYREVEISKKDITDEEEIPGAHLVIHDENGDVVEEWVSGEEPHMVKLHSGRYTLTERKPADGYVTAEEIEFNVLERGEGDFDIQHVEMFDDVTKVEISKQDLTTSQELPGAHLEIKDEDGETVEEWVSTNEPHYIEMLPIGKYTLTETTAPNGYDVAETVNFEVMDTAEIQHVIMYDSPTVTAPKTGDDFNVVTLAAILAAVIVLIAAAVILIVKGKSKKADAEAEPETDKTE